MNKRDRQRYRDALYDEATRDESQPSYGTDRVPAVVGDRCAGSKFGRHRFTSRRNASGLMCDFCTQLRMSDRPWCRFLCAT